MKNVYQLIDEYLLSQLEHNLSNETENSSLRNDIYSDVLNNVINTTFDKLKIMQMKYVFHEYEKGLNAARDNKLESAVLFFKKGDVYINSLNNEEQIEFLRLMTIPNTAYYDYKTGNYSLAITRTEQAMDLQNKLELNIPVLHMGKIQQAHNIIRIKIKLGEYEEAFVFTNQILKYILNYTVPKNYEYHWDFTKLLNTPLELRIAMYQQIFSETVSTSLFYNNIDVKQMYKIVFCDLEEIIEEKGVEKFYGGWIKSVRCYFLGERDLFIREALSFLKKNNTPLYLRVFVISLIYDCMEDENIPCESINKYLLSLDLPESVLNNIFNNKNKIV